MALSPKYLPVSIEGNLLHKGLEAACPLGFFEDDTGVYQMIREKMIYSKGGKTSLRQAISGSWAFALRSGKAEGALFKQNETREQDKFRTLVKRKEKFGL